MTALEICERREHIIEGIIYLEDEVTNNNTGTVLLSNEEVERIIEALKECRDTLEHRLSLMKEGARNGWD